MSELYAEILIKGIVQGVGFRPHVHNLARSMEVSGYVFNHSQGVTIKATAERETIEEFIRKLTSSPPVIAEIHQLEIRWVESSEKFEGFTIRKSDSAGENTVLIPPDVATCRDCLREMENPADPRYRYPFINCTNCGPRFTIITGVPYDRKNTTMAGFPLCPLCDGEYRNPENRRFHAQPVACPQCGPSINLRTVKGDFVETNSDRAIIKTAELLREGKIIAIKGLGGYHLSTDACNEKAVSLLRSRKYREDKPFALMAPDPEYVKTICQLCPEEERALTSHRAPIVLLKKLDNIEIAPSVAPENNCLGIMLPYTPLHHIIMAEFKGPLVMTSANISDEPIAYRDESALKKLSSLADYFLIHNRHIHTRCDDSVIRIFRGYEYPLRRSRGYAPFPIITGSETSIPILSVGAEQKNTFCLMRENQAFLSHHIGDLENIEALQSFEEGISHFKSIFGINPLIIAHDMHPRYLSTRYAENSNLKKTPVLHHHAHIVSCMADNGIKGKVIGMALDGLGYGEDGNLWGFEIMIADETDYQRRFRLKYVPLPGGEKAMREPWRMALSYLHDAFGEACRDLNLRFLRQISEENANILLKLIMRRTFPLISSAGRLFDGASALMGLGNTCHFEGQRAILMETMADETESGEYPLEIIEEDGLSVIDPAPLFRSIVSDIENKASIPGMAGRFHNTLARILNNGAENLRRETGINRVALSGGVFQNMLLLKKTIGLLERNGFEVFYHRRVPANDGGISLGQAVIACEKAKAGR